MPTTPQVPAVRRATAIQQAPEEYEDQWPPRTRTSVVRYTPQAGALPQRQRRSGRALYWAVPLLCICIGACLAATVPSAIQKWHDNSTYGIPCTFQTTANVGHGDPHSPGSHFIALNLSGVLEVIEVPGGDPSAYPPQIYHLTMLAGSGADLVPVTVSFSDVNGDGKLDMAATYGITETVLFNNGKGFVAKL